MTHLVDDIDGDTATKTVAFSFRGVNYEIDLSEKSAAALDEVLTPYLRTPGVSGASLRPHVAATRSPASPREVRAWAKSQGIEVSDRGRISADVMRRYQEAHGG